MKKIVLVAVIIIITFIYVVIGSVLFIDIQVLKAPETTITLDILEINEQNAIVHTMVQVKNPNSFELTTKDFELVLLTETGVEVGRATIAGDTIPPQGEKTFNATVTIGFLGEPVDILRAKISGNVGITIFGFLKKTLPLTVTIITSLDEIMEQLQPPTLQISADFSDISEKGINFTGLITVYNPNAFDISIGDFSTDITAETGDTIGTLQVQGGTIHGKQSTMLQGEGQLLLEALNAQTVSMNMKVPLSIQVAGFEKSFDIESNTQITMPDLNRLLTKEKPLDLIIEGDYKITRKGINVSVTLEIINPHNVTLIAKDLTVTIYQVKGDQKEELGFGVIGDGVVPARGSMRLTSHIMLPHTNIITYLRELTSSDWMLTTVRANLTIPGLGTSVWIGISGYEDLHPFR